MMLIVSPDHYNHRQPCSTHSSTGFLPFVPYFPYLFESLTRIFVRCVSASAYWNFVWPSGVQIGHKHCLLQRTGMPVPPRMGWKWDATDVPGMKVYLLEQFSRQKKMEPYLKHYYDFDRDV